MYFYTVPGIRVLRCISTYFEETGLWHVLSFAKRTSAGFFGGVVFETNTISVVFRSGVRGERPDTSAPDLNTEKDISQSVGRNQ